MPVLVFDQQSTIDNQHQSSRAGCGRRPHRGILASMHRTSPHAPISSKDNSAIKYLRSLADPKHRKKEQAFLIEGIKMVEEALRDDAGVTTIVATPSLVQHQGKGVLKLAESRGVDILWISERLLDAVSESKTPQPVLAVVRMKQHSEEEILGHGAKFIIVAHRLQDPGNLGTIIRTAEAAGASGVALTENTVDPYNAKAVRASMGSTLRFPLVPVGDLPAFLKTCKAKGFQTAATTLTGQKTHFDVDLTKPTAVILGQEGAGLPDDIMAGIDLRVRIPMAETIDSLNVATAAAVILYEAMRQRLGKR
ncbi:MAG: TrmH family RNA methyltransferase [Nitrospirota bacterium]